MKLNLCEVQKIAHRQRWPLNPGHSRNSCVSGTSMGLVLWTSFPHHPSGYWTATKMGFNLDTFFFSLILSSKTHTMDWYYKFDIQFFLPSTPTYNFCYTKKNGENQNEMNTRWWKIPSFFFSPFSEAVKFYEVPCINSWSQSITYWCSV